MKKTIPLLLSILLILTSCQSNEETDAPVENTNQEKIEQTNENETELEANNEEQVSTKEKEEQISITESNDNNDEEDQEALEQLQQREKPILIGTTSGSVAAEALEIACDYLKDQDIEMEVVLFNDYNMPNQALADGSIDYNLMQHLPYLQKWNESHGTDLRPVGEPITATVSSLWSEKIDSIDEIEKGMTIAMPNDNSNRGIYLKMFEELGLITLAETDEHLTFFDIEENPHDLEFMEMETSYLPQSISDVDIVCASRSTWKMSGSDFDLEIYGEPIEELVTYIATQPGNENSFEAKKVHEAVTSDGVREFYESPDQKGVNIPLF